MNVNVPDFTIQRLGDCRIDSPMTGVRFQDDAERMTYLTDVGEIQRLCREGKELPSLELAGPRKRIFHDPAGLACGIVTCGGLCPGLNDVIRSIVLSLYHHYGVKKVYGFRFGYEGLVRRYGHTPLELTPDTVNRINEPAMLERTGVEFSQAFDELFRILTTGLFRNAGE